MSSRRPKLQVRPNLGRRSRPSEDASEKPAQQENVEQATASKQIKLSEKEAVKDKEIDKELKSKTKDVIEKDLASTNKGDAAKALEDTKADTKQTPLQRRRMIKPRVQLPTKKASKESTESTENVEETDIDQTKRQSDSVEECSKGEDKRIETRIDSTKLKGVEVGETDSIETNKSEEACKENVKSDLSSRRRMIKPKVQLPSSRRGKDATKKLSEDKAGTEKKEMKSIQNENIVTSDGEDLENVAKVVIQSPLPDNSDIITVTKKGVDKSVDKVDESPDKKTDQNKNTVKKSNFAKAVPNLAAERKRHSSLSQSDIDDFKYPPNVQRFLSSPKPASVASSPRSTSQDVDIESSIQKTSKKSTGTASKRSKIKITDKSDPKKPRKVQRRTRPLEANVDTSKLTMRELIYLNPVANPMRGTLEEERASEASEPPSASIAGSSPHPSMNSLGSPKEGESAPGDMKKSGDDIPPAEAKMKGDFDDALEEDAEAEGEEEEALHVPQVTIGEDGQIVIQESSLTVAQPVVKPTIDDDLDLSAKVAADRIGYGKKARIKPWSRKETRKFYIALSSIGTDFTLMTALFPDRDRTQLKKKFKLEDKKYSKMVDQALSKRKAFDMSVFDNLTSSEDEVEEEEKKKDSKRKQQKQKKNDNDDAKSSNKTVKKQRKSKKVKSAQFITDDFDDDDDIEEGTNKDVNLSCEKRKQNNDNGVSDDASNDKDVYDFDGESEECDNMPKRRKTKQTEKKKQDRNEEVEKKRQKRLKSSQIEEDDSENIDDGEVCKKRQKRVDSEETEKENTDESDEEDTGKKSKKSLHEEDSDREIADTIIRRKFGKKRKAIIESDDEDDDPRPADEINQMEADNIGQKEVDDISQKKADGICQKKADDISQKKVDVISEKKADDISEKETDDISEKEAEDITQMEADSGSENEADDISEMEADDISLEKADDNSLKKADDISQKKADDNSLKKADDISQKKADNICETVADNSESKRAKKKGKKSRPLQINNNKAENNTAEKIDEDSATLEQEKSTEKSAEDIPTTERDPSYWSAANLFTKHSTLIKSPTGLVPVSPSKFLSFTNLDQSKMQPGQMIFITSTSQQDPENAEKTKDSAAQKKIHVYMVSPAHSSSAKGGSTPGQATNSSAGEEMKSPSVQSIPPITEFLKPAKDSSVESSDKPGSSRDKSLSEIESFKSPNARSPAMSRVPTKATQRRSQSCSSPMQSPFRAIISPAVTQHAYDSTYSEKNKYQMEPCASPVYRELEQDSGSNKNDTSNAEANISKQSKAEKEKQSTQSNTAEDTDKQESVRRIIAALKEGISVGGAKEKIAGMEVIEAINDIEDIPKGASVLNISLPIPDNVIDSVDSLIDGEFMSKNNPESKKANVDSSSNEKELAGEKEVPKETAEKEKSEKVKKESVDKIEDDKQEVDEVIDVEETSCDQPITVDDDDDEDEIIDVGTEDLNASANASIDFQNLMNEIVKEIRCDNETGGEDTNDDSESKGTSENDKSERISQLDGTDNTTTAASLLLKQTEKASPSAPLGSPTPSLSRFKEWKKQSNNNNCKETDKDSNKMPKDSLKSSENAPNIDINDKAESSSADLTKDSATLSPIDIEKAGLVCSISPPNQKTMKKHRKEKVKSSPQQTLCDKLEKAKQESKVDKSSKDEKSQKSEGNAENSLIDLEEIMQQDDMSDLSESLHSKDDVCIVNKMPPSQDEDSNSLKGDACVIVKVSSDSSMHMKTEGVEKNTKKDMRVKEHSVSVASEMQESQESGGIDRRRLAQTPELRQPCRSDQPSPLASFDKSFDVEHFRKYFSQRAVKVKKVSSRLSSEKRGATPDGRKEITSKFFADMPVGQDGIKFEKERIVSRKFAENLNVKIPCFSPDTSPYIGPYEQKNSTPECLVGSRSNPAERYTMPSDNQYPSIRHRRVSDNYSHQYSSNLDNPQIDRCRLMSDHHSPYSTKSSPGVCSGNERMMYYTKEPFYSPVHDSYSRGRPSPTTVREERIVREIDRKSTRTLNERGPNVNSEMSRQCVRNMPSQRRRIGKSSDMNWIIRRPEEYANIRSRQQQTQSLYEPHYTSPQAYRPQERGIPRTSSYEPSTSRASSSYEPSTSRTLSSYEANTSRNMSPYEQSISRTIPSYEPSTSRVLSSYEPSTSRTLSPYEQSNSRTVSSYEPSTSRTLSPYEPSTSRTLSPYEPSTSRTVSSYEPGTTRTLSPYDPSTSQYVQTFSRDLLPGEGNSRLKSMHENDMNTQQMYHEKSRRSSSSQSQTFRPINQEEDIKPDLNSIRMSKGEYVLQKLVGSDGQVLYVLEEND